MLPFWRNKVHIKEYKKWEDFINQILIPPKRNDLRDRHCKQKSREPHVPFENGLVPLNGRIIIVIKRWISSIEEIKNELEKKHSESASKPPPGSHLEFQSRDHTISDVPFPIDDPLKPFSRYLAAKVLKNERSNERTNKQTNKHGGS